MNPDGVKFRYHRGKLLLYAVVAGALAATGAYFYIASFFASRPVGGIAPPLALFMALACSLVLVLALRMVTGARTPVVEVGPDGIRDVRLGHRTIPWTAIVALRGFDLRKNRVARPYGAFVHDRINRSLAIVVNDVDAYYHPPYAVVRTMGRITRLFGTPPLAISMSGLDGSYDDLVEAARVFARGRDIPIEP